MMHAFGKLVTELLNLAGARFVLINTEELVTALLESIDVKLTYATPNNVLMSISIAYLNDHIAT